MTSQVEYQVCTNKVEDVFSWEYNMPDKYIGSFSEYNYAYNFAVWYCSDVLGVPDPWEYVDFTIEAVEKITLEIPSDNPPHNT